MPKFFIEQVIDEQTQCISLTDRDAHHIAHVLRLKPGDGILVCDGARTDLHCEIEQISDRAVQLKILHRSLSQTEPPYQVVLYQGLVKGDKMSQIIQKSVELGVTSIVPVICRRSVSTPAETGRDKKNSRWNRIAEEAAKQCGRGICPDVQPICLFEDSLRTADPAELAIIPWEQERRCSIRSVLDQLSDEADELNPIRINLWIGPEGGFTEAEIELARQAGVQAVTLGKRILRTETAGPAVLAMMIYRFDDF